MPPIPPSFLLCLQPLTKSTLTEGNIFFDNNSISSNTEISIDTKRQRAAVCITSTNTTVLHLSCHKVSSSNKLNTINIFINSES